MFEQASEFSFLANLKRDWQLIRDELLALNKTYFVEWPERNIYDGNWTVFGLYKLGEKVEQHCALCPITTKLIEEIPGLLSAGFSSLAPGTYIGPHVGYTNRVLRYHLGLVTPENCAIRVDKETKSWEAGEDFIFDDTYEHEAWNRSESTRVVLLLDFKRDVNEQIDFPEDVRGFDPIAKN
jgi:aspartyl/asparaginyl beta-hydroxylase (cupin superfamily)